MLWSLALLGSPVAVAHPFGGTLPGHELHLRLSPQAVELRYSARVPTHEILAELKGRELSDPAAFTLAKLDELADNLALDVDGQRLSWSREPSDAETGLGNSRSITYEQTLRAELPPGARTLHISNGNYPDQTSYFYWEVQVMPPLRVATCSLLDLDGSRVLRTRDAQWRMDEEQRELRLELEPSVGFWAALGRLAEPTGEEPLALDAALALGPAHDMRSGRLPPQPLALGILGAALGALDVRRQWRIGLPWLGIAVALALAVALPAGGAMGAAATLGAVIGLWLPAPAGRLMGWAGRVALALFAAAAGLSLLGA